MSKTTNKKIRGALLCSSAVLLLTACQTASNSHIPWQEREAVKRAVAENSQSPTLSDAIAYAEAVQAEIIKDYEKRKRLENNVALGSIFTVGALAVDASIDPSPDATRIGLGLIATSRAMLNWLNGDITDSSETSLARDQDNAFVSKSISCAVWALSPIEAVDANKLGNALDQLAEGIKSVEANKNTVALAAANLDSDQKKLVTEYLGQVSESLASIQTTYKNGQALLDDLRLRGRELRTTVNYLETRLFERDIRDRARLSELQGFLQALAVEVPAGIEFTTPDALVLGQSSSADPTETGNRRGDQSGGGQENSGVKFEETLFWQSYQKLAEAFGDVKSATIIINAIVNNRQISVAPDVMKKECGIEITAAKSPLQATGGSNLSFTQGTAGKQSVTISGGNNNYAWKQRSGDFNDITVSQNGTDFTVSTTDKTAAGRRSLQVYDRQSPGLFVTVYINVVADSAVQASQKEKDKNKNKKDTANDPVTAAQQQLRNLNFLTKDDLVDGDCDKITKNAIAQFYTTIQLPDQATCPPSETLKQNLETYLKVLGQSGTPERVRRVTIEKLLQRGSQTEDIQKHIEVDGTLTKSEWSLIEVDNKRLNQAPSINEEIAILTKLRGQCS
ncbi:MAG: hypothetical protein ACE37D_14230 [Pseudomonadales bacterium]